MKCRCTSRAHPELPIALVLVLITAIAFSAYRLSTMINQWRLSMRMHQGMADISSAHPYLSFDADQCRCRMTMDYHTTPTISSTDVASATTMTSRDDISDPLADWLLRHSPDTPPSKPDDWYHATTDFRCVCSQCHTICSVSHGVRIWYDPLDPDTMVQLTPPDALPVTITTAITVAMLPVLLAAISLCCALCYACADRHHTDDSDLTLLTNIHPPPSSSTLVVITNNNTNTAGNGPSAPATYGACDSCPPTPEHWRWTIGTPTGRRW